MCTYPCDVKISHHSLIPWRGELPCHIVLIALLWLILEDERSEFETMVYVSAAATCFAVQCNMTVFNDHFGLGILAVLVQNGLCVCRDSLRALKLYWYH